MILEQKKGYQHMKPKTSGNNQSTATAREHYTTGSVTSQDGTTIDYRQLGHGPGVVLLHGTASSGYNHIQLAEALADAFTIYVPDRRTLGLNGPYSKDYSIQKEVEDLDALLTKTGAHNVFGVSSGGIICLQAALTLHAIHKAAIYEPPLFINGVPTAVLARFDQEMAEGKVAAALITAMKGAQMGPPIFNVVPRRLLELLTNMAMKGEDKKGSGGYVPMRALAPAMHYDFQLAVDMSDKLENFRAVRAEVLLLGGSKSPAYLKGALDALEKVLPHAKRVELPGVGHAASWNTDRGGKPELVAQELRRFFAEP
jgi:pimeloyl-ACP methyl ester carboxylesterase